MKKPIPANRLAKLTGAGIVAKLALTGEITGAAILLILTMLI